MQLNRVLQKENDRLKKEILDLRKDDMNWHVRWWKLWATNTLLWEFVNGLACTRTGRKSDKNIHREDHFMTEEEVRGMDN